MSPEEWQYKLYLMGRSATADLHPTQAAVLATVMETLLTQNKQLLEETARLTAALEKEKQATPGKRRSGVPRT